MKYEYPASFIDFDSWVEYSEDLRRQWSDSQFWKHYGPEKWAELFPEMKDWITELYLTNEDLVSKLKTDFSKTEELFSQDLNTRLFEEANLDQTLGKVISRLEKKVKNYKRMVAFYNPVPPRENENKITDQDIEIARDYPIIELLPELPKRGFVHCPFHLEKSPSCKVFPDHIHCFGCGKHLDSIGYLMETQGKTFIDSVKYLCRK